MTTSSPDMTHKRLPARYFADVNVNQYTYAPLQLKKVIELSTSPEQVFATLSDYSAMPDWVPGMSYVAVDNTKALLENGVGTVRTCNFEDGQSMVEDIVLFDAPTMLAYSVRDGNFMGMSEHFALITMQASKQGCVLSWYQFFNHPDVAAFVAQSAALLDTACDQLKLNYSPVVRANPSTELA
ncbi:MAG: SRPBCC family protein [Deinococcota bacterium]